MTNLLQFMSICSDEAGEVEGFFRDGELIASWCSNDAAWRGEYMDGLLRQLGFEVEDVLEGENDELEKQLVEAFS